MGNGILTPAAVLVLWTIVMLFWVGATRLPALKSVGIDMSKAVGGRGADLEGVLPARVNWKSHNYTHLVEQPTIFYATVAILAIAGASTPLNVALAWAYVGLRILHSLVQATVNRIAFRFPTFALSSLTLLALAVNALRATL
ncbi:MAPEG family protein [Sphingomonas sp. LaA6.9]|uniref:MAPEG family protein n=1 Tax=Sphingomonas sp. LaA6.9 TaxID=2919914 RepID=UPI001F4F6D22|nr:MAPEG family protein [Sphingomonas sp. LaA6.9]MCJ8157503.1 MAPEG family protein [Sphingomonas sp. LaA6.9]